MSVVDTAHVISAPADAGRIARITHALQRAQQAHALRVLYRQTIRELRTLNDTDLADLGIVRANIPAAAYEATYGV